MQETMVTTASIDKFLLSLTAKGRSDETIRAYRGDLTTFLREMGTHPLSKFEANAQKFLTLHRKKVAAKTTRRRLGTLRVFGRFMGLDAPLRDYRAPTPARPMPHPLPEQVDGVKRMIACAANHEERALVALCGLAGMRVSETLSVTIASFDFEERTIKIRGKGEKERIIPLFASVEDHVMPRIQEILRGNHNDPMKVALVDLHERSARRAITRLGARAGLKRGAASHDLRATFATAAYAKSGDLRAVQELLGHADSRTTEVYTGISMEKMREAGDVG